MTELLVSPRRYVQGAGAINDIGKHASLYGERALITGSPTGISATRGAILESLDGEGVVASVEPFEGECTWSEITRLKRIAEKNDCDMVIGVGGGKGLDTAKAVACEVGASMVIVPTIASTDAPCSAVSVVYNSEHVFERNLYLSRNPDLVLVDTEVCVKAPVRFFVAGMGDALATWFEADACHRSGAMNSVGGGPGPGRSTIAALALARLCYDTLMEFGVQGKEAAERGVVTPAVEKVVEANTLLSGIGFESGGLAAAHSIHNGFTILEHKHRMYHGEVVAFGTLTQMVLEGRSTEEIDEVLDFCDSVGLPYDLAQMGLEDAGEEELLEVAKKACAEGESIHNMAFQVTPASVRDAIRGADAIGRAYKR